jgi:hypothetical protein
MAILKWCFRKGFRNVHAREYKCRGVCGVQLQISDARNENCRAEYSMQGTLGGDEGEAGKRRAK